MFHLYTLYAVLDFFRVLSKITIEICNPICP